MKNQEFMKKNMQRIDENADKFKSHFHKSLREMSPRKQGKLI